MLYNVGYIKKNMGSRLMLVTLLLSTVFNTVFAQDGNIKLCNSHWVQKNSPGQSITWIFKNDSTIYKTKVWPESGPKYDIGKFHIDKQHKKFLIQWGFKMPIGDASSIAYTDPQTFYIVKWTKSEIILSIPNPEGKTSESNSELKSSYIYLVRELKAGSYIFKQPAMV